VMVQLMTRWTLCIPSVILSIPDPSPPTALLFTTVINPKPGKFLKALVSSPFPVLLFFILPFPFFSQHPPLKPPLQQFSHGSPAPPCHFSFFRPSVTAYPSQVFCDHLFLSFFGLLQLLPFLAAGSRYFPVSHSPFFFDRSLRMITSRRHLDSISPRSPTPFSLLPFLVRPPINLLYVTMTSNSPGAGYAGPPPLPPFSSPAFFFPAPFDRPPPSLLIGEFDHQFAGIVHSN